MYPDLVTKIFEAAQKHYVELDNDTIYAIIDAVIGEGWEPNDQ